MFSSETSAVKLLQSMFSSKTSARKFLQILWTCASKFIVNTLLGPNVQPPAAARRSDWIWLWTGSAPVPSWRRWTSPSSTLPLRSPASGPASWTPGGHACPARRAHWLPLFWRLAPCRQTTTLLPLSAVCLSVACPAVSLPCSGLGSLPPHIQGHGWVLPPLLLLGLLLVRPSLRLPQRFASLLSALVWGTPLVSPQVSSWLASALASWRACLWVCSWLCSLPCSSRPPSRPWPASSSQQELSWVASPRQCLLRLEFFLAFVCWYLRPASSERRSRPPPTSLALPLLLARKFIQKMLGQKPHDHLYAMRLKIGQGAQEPSQYLSPWLRTSNLQRLASSRKTCLSPQSSYSSDNKMFSH